MLPLAKNASVYAARPSHLLAGTSPLVLHSLLQNNTRQPWKDIIRQRLPLYLLIRKPASPRVQANY
jgi:hypothetical protein